ncbi:MAG: hypothetical protein LBD77_06310 [Bifidobacteriaceae bacterium]|nr:hypothetical protein [Bifidobacteriaceae bacterium]
MPAYVPRLCDRRIAELLGGQAAVMVVGPRASCTAGAARGLLPPGAACKATVDT